MVDKDGIRGLLGRGLYTRLLTNGLQASPRTPPLAHLSSRAEASMAAAPCTQLPQLHTVAPPDSSMRMPEARSSLWLALAAEPTYLF